jgi:pimeloyl-ACP methyl ester carboxylesterase
MISIASWRARGKMIDTPDGAVFVVDLGAGDDTPVFVLHGFPTSSWDFAPALERVAEHRRVVAFDFLGYGLSDKPAGYGYSLFEQADVALRVARDLGLWRVHLWSHDMGTSVATELLARRERGFLPIAIESYVLMNGSVHIELAELTLGQKLLKSPLGPVFAKLNSKTTFKAQMRRVFATPPADDDLDAMWELASREDGLARMPQLIRYTEERTRFRRRWIGALERCTLPALVAWGRKDPVAVMAIAEQLAREIPGAKLETWAELGHYPQVEDPARVVATVSAFWDACNAAASARASFKAPAP